MKRDPDGKFTRATARITYADTGDETKAADCFSACLYGEAARYLIAVAAQLPEARVTANDVSGVNGSDYSEPVLARH